MANLTIRWINRGRMNVGNVLNTHLTGSKNIMASIEMLYSTFHLKISFWFHYSPLCTKLSRMAALLPSTGQSLIRQQHCNVTSFPSRGNALSTVSLCFICLRALFSCHIRKWQWQQLWCLIYSFHVSVNSSNLKTGLQPEILKKIKMFKIIIISNK